MLWSQGIVNKCRQMQYFLCAAIIEELSKYHKLLVFAILLREEEVNFLKDIL